tara:strand:+ start:2388 stop:3449 length:1062 start_codon:yes stop_codon:yes gene_type:complete
MNVLEVQDALKDFSQEQLVKEMQMPSGQAPQFLVLSELNRRQRMKQDFEARQAQQQPTVAEKLVAAAGAPQGGIGAMAQSMAPQTDMAMNTGIAQMQEPMSGEAMGMNMGGSTSPIYGGSTGNPNPSFFDRLITGLKPSNFGKSYRDLYGVRPGPSNTYGEGKLGINPATGKRIQNADDVEEAYRQMVGMKPMGAQGFGLVRGGASQSEGTETIQDRIMDLMEQRQKSADMDKYLALAQAGFTLMQPTEGGFGEALGKAGVAGIQAYQDASDRYQTGLADVLDTEIALQKAATSGETSGDRVKNFTETLKALIDLQELGAGEVDLRSDIESVRSRLMGELGGRGTVDLGSLSN